MAHRHVFAIQPSDREDFRLEWDAPGDDGLSVAHLGSLDWSVFVHDKLTIDLEVSVELKPQEPDGESKLVVLDEPTRDVSFSGNFQPTTDERMKASFGEGQPDDQEPKVAAVIFQFSNVFSWWNAKRVELILVRHRPSDKRSALVEPLPLHEPCAPPQRCVPRPMRDGTVPVVGSRAPELQAVALRVDECELARFSSYLAVAVRAAQDAAAAAGETVATGTSGGVWLEELHGQLLTLQAMCKRTPSAEDVSQAPAQEPVVEPVVEFVVDAGAVEATDVAEIHVAEDGGASDEPVENQGLTDPDAPCQEHATSDGTADEPPEHDNLAEADASGHAVLN